MKIPREEKPNYILKANEGVIVPKNDNFSKLKKVVWIIVGLVIIGSFIFQENIFSELTWSARIMLIVLAIGVSFAGGNKMVPSPFEIQFYDDYLIVYREKHYYSKKHFKKEYNKFCYKDIKEFKYRTVSKKMNIIGVGEFTWYNYNQDGTLPEKPSFHKKGSGITWFYTSEAPEVDFVAEIEKNSPIKVSLNES
ncbi:hypothetical protein [Ornithinibacillus halotolerans]|uniref:Uncharacterized protein n=1 Tax=Ornithinibacillus halotolerans TaxID=1274357 RepID=A0A916S382_9BACI|nr:hypothetical protein [Ornithinibacillus halotolerans]GGA79709.1 hypothetical protein GCM10008025_23900 [Ornithinibacillus halotolerans]